jgi:hypothetical protein
MKQVWSSDSKKGDVQDLRSLTNRPASDRRDSLGRGESSSAIMDAFRNASVPLSLRQPYPLPLKAAEAATKVPGTSSLSMWKQKQDRDWLERLDPSKATPEGVKRMERLSIRMQCLLSDMPGCFLL